MHPLSPHAPARRRTRATLVDDPLDALALQLRATGAAGTRMKGAHPAAKALAARRAPGAQRAAFRSPPSAR